MNKCIVLLIAAYLISVFAEEIQEKCGEGADKDVHKCVPYYACDPDTYTIISDYRNKAGQFVDTRMNRFILVLVGITLVGTFAQDVVRVVSPTETLPEVIEKCGEGKDKGVHLCVSYYNCDAETKTIIPQEEYDRNNRRDIRFGSNSCANSLEVCCKIPNDRPLPPEVVPNTSFPINPEIPAYCGSRNPDGVDFKITGNKYNAAEYGEFPWMLAILNKTYIPSSYANLALCGGSLIAPNVVLTGAHCVFKHKTEDLVIRGGEWDTQTEIEPYPYQERYVKQIIIHEGFVSKYLFKDIALLVLDRPFDRAPHIGTICLPPQNTILHSRECYATGWGKHVFGKQGKYRVVLKQIKLPIVHKSQCQEALQKTRLGENFKLHESFICAGGEPECIGDGGSPLVCPDPNNPKRYVQAGIVAWSIGCGNDGIPGVYVDVANFRDWIDQNIIKLNIDSSSYNV